mmetsp:Transcript_26773/g.58316  ORF Transcript_26773/g.58316 Transcript_26773/m.58316 type:complete len:390 (-) Transcript_26773:1164-2333(-)
MDAVPADGGVRVRGEGDLQDDHRHRSPLQRGHPPLLQKDRSGLARHKRPGEQPHHALHRRPFRGGGLALELVYHLPGRAGGGDDARGVLAGAARSGEALEGDHQAGHQDLHPPLLGSQLRRERGERAVRGGEGEGAHAAGRHLPAHAALSPTHRRDGALRHQPDRAQGGQLLRAHARGLARAHQQEHGRAGDGAAPQVHHHGAEEARGPEERVRGLRESAAAVHPELAGGAPRARGHAHRQGQLHPHPAARGARQASAHGGGGGGARDATVGGEGVRPQRGLRVRRAGAAERERAAGAGDDRARPPPAPPPPPPGLHHPAAPALADQAGAAGAAAEGNGAGGGGDGAGQDGPVRGGRGAAADALQGRRHRPLPRPPRGRRQGASKDEGR